ncbi:hypothetical protein QBC40DRAFT_283076 [Triangularia verruculosa]|uniref:Uncharacterized protein n=1 Tax=Triangularia verruculosa TaxID=2587418 RepID=A0AAN7ATI0_9PEZI|nr:hypothetical protein QBC40DRAFT_283076 [Triangularia verruculosa]
MSAYIFVWFLVNTMFCCFYLFFSVSFFSRLHILTAWATQHKIPLFSTTTNIMMEWVSKRGRAGEVYEWKTGTSRLVTVELDMGGFIPAVFFLPNWGKQAIEFREGSKRAIRKVCVSERMWDQLILGSVYTGVREEFIWD